MHKLSDNLAQVFDRIHSASNQFSVPSPQLLAVSKKRSSAEIREIYQLGVHQFGENYLQEALTKKTELEDLAITWHFIGPIQSNKTRSIAENFHWVHSVDRIKIAQRLNDQCPDGKIINICAQINLDNEDSKSGLAINELSEFADAINNCSNLSLRGLMTIPAPRDNFDDQKQAFKEMKDALTKLKTEFPELPLDTLSMGMSSDLEAAIAAGATIVRVGTDIFGPR
jgi:pyridoxal phosphate enzyme (YggS family)